MNDNTDGQWLDAMYNNRALVPDHADYFARWSEWSAPVRAHPGSALDVAYGEAPAEKLDVFRAPQAGAPVLVFIHGGYWRSLDKKEHAFVAPAFTRQGVCVVVPNYTLCPGITIPGICLQMVSALAWTWKNIERFGGDRRRIVVAGHSAGGHLAAMMAACDWPAFDHDLPGNLLQGALSISGLHELEPIMNTPFLQPSLRLTADDARRASPARLPAPAEGRLYSVCGGDESEEFLRQNVLIQQAWGRGRVPVCEALPGLNHFSVLEGLAQPGHRLHQLALDLLKG